MKNLFLLFLLLLVFSLVAACVSTPAEDEHSESGETHWGYEAEEGPDNWFSLGYEDCGGSEQSPVDIPGNAKIYDSDIIYNYASTKLNIVNNGHTIKISCDKGNTIEVNGKTFELLQFHFHSQSEHTVNSAFYIIEMHLVHQSEDGEYAVIGVFIEEGDENVAYNSFMDKFPKEKGELETIEGVIIELSALLPKTLSLYKYDGSFTTPPCTEGINWFVLNKSVSLSKEQIKCFTNIYDNNNRPVQPVNERTF